MAKKADSKLVFGAQVRAARALLNWSQGELAMRAGVSKQSVNRIENGSTDARLSTLDAIREVLQRAGVEIIEGPTGTLQIAINTSLL